MRCARNSPLDQMEICVVTKADVSDSKERKWCVKTVLGVLVLQAELGKTRTFTGCRENPNPTLPHPHPQCSDSADKPHWIHTGRVFGHISVQSRHRETPLGVHSDAPHDVRAVSPAGAAVTTCNKKCNTEAD